MLWPTPPLEPQGSQRGVSGDGDGGRNTAGGNFIGKDLSGIKFHFGIKSYTSQTKIAGYLFLNWAKISCCFYLE